MTERRGGTSGKGSAPFPEVLAVFRRLFEAKNIEMYLMEG
jgi:hypothetical protein